MSNIELPTQIIDEYSGSGSDTRNDLWSPDIRACSDLEGQVDTDTHLNRQKLLKTLEMLRVDPCGYQSDSKPNPKRNTTKYAPINAPVPLSKEEIKLKIERVNHRIANNLSNEKSLSQSDIDFIKESYNILIDWTWMGMSKFSLSTNKFRFELARYRLFHRLADQFQIDADFIFKMFSLFSQTYETGHRLRADETGWKEPKTKRKYGGKRTDPLVGNYKTGQ